MENRRRKAEFTLIELLVTIAIVVILVGITLAGVGYARRRADEAKTVAILEQLSQGLEAFRAENGYYPPCATEAEVKFKMDGAKLQLVLGDATAIDFCSAKTGENFCALNGFSDTAAALQDSWDRAFTYQCPGKHNKTSFDLRSKGPKEGDEADDVTNWGDNKH